MQEIRACLEGLAGVPVVLESMALSIPEARRSLRRGQHVWTITEHVAHMAQVQAMLLKRSVLFLEEDLPVMTPFNPFAQSGAPDARDMGFEDALADFADLRRAQLDVFSGMPPGAWDRRAVHPEYTDYSLRILARHLLLHDHSHLYRIEEIWLLRDEFFA